MLEIVVTEETSLILIQIYLKMLQASQTLRSLISIFYSIAPLLKPQKPPSKVSSKTFHPPVPLLQSNSNAPLMLSTIYSIPADPNTSLSLLNPNSSKLPTTSDSIFSPTYAPKSFWVARSMGLSSNTWHVSL